MVQRVRYNYGGFWFIFKLFDGTEEKIDAGYVQGMSITTRFPWDEQYEQAEEKFLGFREQGI